jgi:hypothetical protein
LSRFKKAGASAGMSIIDVGILTGFSVKQETLVEVNLQPLAFISIYDAIES